MAPETLTADQFGQLVEVVVWALGFALVVIITVAAGPGPWVALGRLLAALGRRYVAVAARVPDSETRDRERRSHAAERDREPSGTPGGNAVPAMVPVTELPELLAMLDDETLAELLALIPGDKGGYRFADSAIAKLMPGRNEAWLPLIREVRDKPEPEARPEGRVVALRHHGQERLVPME